MENALNSRESRSRRALPTVENEAPIDSCEARVRKDKYGFLLICWHKEGLILFRSVLGLPAPFLCSSFECDLRRDFIL